MATTEFFAEKVNADMYPVTNLLNYGNVHIIWRTNCVSRISKPVHKLGPGTTSLVRMARSISFAKPFGDEPSTW